jgi:predicted dehydrogenase
MAENQRIIGTALLSCGMSGRVFHGPLLAVSPGYAVRKILKRSSRQREALFPASEIASSLDEVLNDREVELVIVNTPNDSHFDYALRALRAGKHVVVEKPFTITVNEADQLIEEARKWGRLLTVFQNRRLDGDSLTVKKILSEGRLGRLVEYEAHYDRYRPVVDESTWKERNIPGAGILYNLGSHLIDGALHLFGLPKGVDARLGRQRTGAVADDYFDIRMEYDGLLVILKSGYLVCEPSPRFILHGEKGSFVKYGLDPQEMAMKEGKLPGGGDWGKDPEEYWGTLTTSVSGSLHRERIETVRGNYPDFYARLYRSITQGVPLAVTAEQGRDVIRVIEAVMESAAKQQAVLPKD